MEKLNLNKKVYAKNQYERVIDTKFSQLATSLTQNQIDEIIRNSSTTISIEQFFDYYNQLFFQIPKTGPNSHEYLIKTSSEYINFNPLSDEIQALIEEINSLQQDNLNLNQQLIEAKLPSTGSQQNINL